MVMDFDSEKQLFNMAAAFTFHLYNHIVLCSDYAMQENVEEWYKTLKSLFRKTIPFIKEEEEKKLEEMFKSIDWNSYNFLKTKNKNRIEFINVKKDIIEKLEKIEEMLMKLLKKYALLMPHPEDPRFAILRG